MNSMFGPISANGFVSSHFTCRASRTGHQQNLVLNLMLYSVSSCRPTLRCSRPRNGMVLRSQVVSAFPCLPHQCVCPLLPNLTQLILRKIFNRNCRLLIKVVDTLVFCCRCTHVWLTTWVQILFLVSQSILQMVHCVDSHNVCSYATSGRFHNVLTKQFSYCYP